MFEGGMLDVYETSFITIKYFVFFLDFYFGLWTMWQQHQKISLSVLGKQASPFFVHFNIENYI